jgi:hypothetical protein
MAELPTTCIALAEFALRKAKSTYAREGGR